jgi:predicted  nucleic acid-binding Zn-ribbon protein
MRHICDNCGAIYTDNTLHEVVGRLESRTEPGGIVPSGECVKCGALCYPERKKAKKSEGEKTVEEAINLLDIFTGLMASLLDGNKSPDKKFIRAMSKTAKNNIRNLKKLLP